MSVLSGNSSSSTRLVEAIAGSSGSIIDPTSAIGDLPILGTLTSTDGETHPTANTTDGVDAGPLDLVSSLTGESGLTDPLAAAGGLALAGNGTSLQPLLDAANSAIKEVHYELELLSHQTGTSDIVHSITNLGETIGLGEIGTAPAPGGPTNLLTDVLNLPSNLLSGNLEGIISDVGHDLTNVIGSLLGVKDAVIFGSDPLNPIPELIQGIGHDLSSLPLLSIGDGDQGGLLSGLVGDLSHSSSNHLADVNVGPEQDSGGLPINLLAANESGPHHTVDVNAVNVGPNGPHLAALDLLTGGAGLGGGDSLAGNLLNLGTLADASHAAPLGIPSLPVLPQVGDASGLDLGGLLNADHGILNLHSVHMV